jgi:tetratricopeptide (TPR) repeat protein
MQAMDLTTLAAALMFALGLLATDSVLHSGSVAVEVAAPADVYRQVIDQQTLEGAFTTQLDRIANTISVVNPPEIRSSRDEGIGMTLAEAASVKSLAFALQRQIGYSPDRLRFALFMEGGALRGVVSGFGHARGAFSQEFVPEKDEKLMNFVQRSAIWGGSQLAPYTTALFLLQSHAGDGDLRDVVALAEHAMAMLPPAPISRERAEFQNLLGLVDLFHNDPAASREHFQAGAKAWPEGPVPELNIAFTEIQVDEYAAAAARVRALLARMPPTTHKAVLGTAHMELGAALMGLRDWDAADAALARALEINPDNSSTPDLWAQLKAQRGDAAGAERLRRIAQQNTAAFENFGEMAALYFELSWRNDEPVLRSKFGNPGVVAFH